MFAITADLDQPVSVAADYAREMAVFLFLLAHLAHLGAHCAQHDFKGHALRRDSIISGLIKGAHDGVSDEELGLHFPAPV